MTYLIIAMFVTIMIGAVFGAPLFWKKIKSRYPDLSGKYLLPLYFAMWVFLLYIFKEPNSHDLHLFSGVTLVFVKMFVFIFLMFLLSLGIYSIFYFFKKLIKYSP